MQIVDNFVILLLIVLAFIAGNRLSDKYNSRIIAELQYQLRISAAKEGIGYVAPPQRCAPIGEQFMDRLKTNGKAVQKIDKRART